MSNQDKYKQADRENAYWHLGETGQDRKAHDRTGQRKIGQGSTDRQIDREREGEGEREIQRETEGQRDRETERQTETETDRLRIKMNSSKRTRKCRLAPWQDFDSLSVV